MLESVSSSVESFFVAGITKSAEKPLIKVPKCVTVLQCVEENVMQVLNNGCCKYMKRNYMSTDRLYMCFQ